MVISGIAIYFGMTLLIVSVDSRRMIRSHCDDLMCENESPCQTMISHDQTDTEIQIECICQGRWTGPRCELEIMLGATDVRQDSVRLEIRTRSPKNITHISNPQSKYTLKYWSNSTDNACLLVQEVTSSVHVIDGLLSSLYYTFCCETGIVDYCEVTRFGVTLPSNCVIVQTLHSSSVAPESSFIGIGVSLIVVFLAMIIIVFVGIILLKKYHRLQLDLFMGLCPCHACVHKSNDEKRSSPPLQSRFLLSPDASIYTPTANTELPPSKVNSRLAKRAKHYGAKSEGNQTLTTLIENTEDIVVLGETSLSEPLH